MRKQTQKRLLSVVLLIAMLASLLVVPAGAAPADKAGTFSLEFEEIQVSGDELDGLYQDTADCGSTAGQDSDLAEEFDAEDIVRVSVVLDSPSALAAGYSVDDLTEDDSDADRYREALRMMQEYLTEYLVEQELVSTLEVKRNLTMAANMLSAEVKYGEIGNIEAVEGVLEVIVENCYSPMINGTRESGDSGMVTSNVQTGSSTAYDLNYTGAGSRIAIIDTGLDLDHSSFDADAFQYSLEETARRKLIEQGIQDPTAEQIDQYIAGLDLLDADEINGLRDKLNISQKVSTDQMYYNSKVAFGYNYVDENINIVHDFDTKGEHGSHVAGIAAANRYIADGDGGYVSALDKVKTQGIAFDAQLLVMKVFGRNGGAYDSDIITAIEDALLLGADAINLSLGTTVAGFNTYASEAFQKVFDELEDENVVLSVSAGNDSYFFDDSFNGARLYADDVNFDRLSAPASVSSAVAVASVDNADSVHLTFTAGDEELPYYTVKNKAGDAKQLYDLEPGEYDYIILTGYGAAEGNIGYGYSADEYTAIGGEETVKGKIVFASRGGDALTALTARPILAAQYGAAACVVYNDRGGVTVMSFGSAECSIPSATTSKQAADRLLGMSTPVYAETQTEGTGDNKEPLYYTGKLTITSDKTLVSTAGTIDPQYSEISYFSAWGIPGSLELKPEISAPGGGVYSVDGSVSSGDAYEFMSGTSMAAPQISGMVAVVAQYIRENDLSSGTGLSVRQLAQSLLMSTATPLLEEEGKYVSVLAQGAGLANVGAAVAAESCIDMAGDTDGKVKAELGDDSDRNGEYTVAFTIKSLTDEEIAYELSADLFTQSAYMEDDVWYQSTATSLLSADISFRVNGEEYALDSSVSCDLNGDGVTDAKDAQIILEYMVGLSTVIDGNAAKKTLADVDRDGSITTRDAYLILSDLTTRAVRIPAGGSARVEVSIVYPQTLKSYLDSIYVNGAYIEGFIHVTPVACPDGGETVYAHSIPVLGYYGSWTDPSMFDRTTAIGQTYDNVEELASYAQNSAAGLRYTPYYGSKEIWYTGNPFTEMEEYPAGKEAISEEAVLQSYVFTPMRNMAALMSYIKNDTTGEYVYTGPVYQYTYAGYGGYTASGAQAWAYQDLSVAIGQKLSTLDGISEDDRLTVGLVAVPEYYGYPATAEEMIDLMETGALGDGAYLTTSFALDNTAPELIDAKSTTETSLTDGETKKSLVLTIRDNQFVAYAALTSSDGLTMYGNAVPVYADGAEAGSAVTVTFDLSEIAAEKKLDADKLASSCRILLGDYAGNLRAYQIKGESASEDTGGLYLFGYVSNSASANKKIDATSLSYLKTGKVSNGILKEENVPVYVIAAEYARGYVFMMGKDNCLYAAEAKDLSNIFKVCQYDSNTYGTFVFRDLTYDAKNDIMYALDGKSYNDETNIIYTIDLETGAATEAFRISVQEPNEAFRSQKARQELTAFCTDGNGRFYGVNNGNLTSATAKSYLYTWTLDDVEDAKNKNAEQDDVNAEIDDEKTEIVELTDWKAIDPDQPTGYVSYISNSTTKLYGGSMTWVESSKTLLWLTSYASTSVGSRLVQFTMDENGELNPKAELINGTDSTIAGCISNSGGYGLYQVPKEETNSLLPTDEAYQIVLSDTELGLMIRDSAQLTAEVFPWNLTDKSITWSSDNTDVAIVNQDGVVTAVGVGEATITVTATAEGKGGVPCTAACTVTVQDVPEIGFSALIEDANGTYWAEDGLNSLNFASAGLTGNEQESRDLQLGAQTGSTFLFRDEDNDFVILDADSGDVLDEVENWLDAAWDCITGLPVIENTRNWAWANLKDYQNWNKDEAPDEAFGMYLAAYRSGNRQRLAVISQEGQKINDVAVFSSYFTSDTIVAIAAGEMGAITGATPNCPSVRVYVLTENGKLYYADMNAKCSDANVVTYTNPTSFTSCSTNCVATEHGSANTMFYDKATGKLLLFSSSQGGATTLYTIDAATGSYTVNGTRNGSTVQAVYRYEKRGEDAAVIRGLDKNAAIYAGKTVQLNAWVAPAVGGTTALTWSSSDATVATVDQRGLVTGVYDDGGTGGSKDVIITAAAVGNPDVKAECTVTVTARTKLSEDVDITALVSDKFGNAYWSEFSANDLDNVDQTVKSSKNFAAVGWSADGYLYGLDGLSSYRKLYRIDPENYSVADQNAVPENIASIGRDIAAAPAKTIQMSGEDETRELFGGMMVDLMYLMEHLTADTYPTVEGGTLSTHNDNPDGGGDRQGVIYLGPGENTAEGFPTLRYLVYSYKYVQLVTVTPKSDNGDVVYWEERQLLFRFDLPHASNAKHMEGIYVPGEGLVFAVQNADDGEVDFWFIELDMETWTSTSPTPTPKYMGSLAGAYDVVGMYTDRDVALAQAKDNAVYQVTLQTDAGSTPDAGEGGENDNTNNDADNDASNDTNAGDPDDAPILGDDLNGDDPDEDTPDENTPNEGDAEEDASDDEAPQEEDRLPASALTGSTMALTGELELRGVSAPKARPGVSVCGRTVTLQLVSERSVPNGLFTVSYDPRTLTYDSAAVSAALSAVSVDETSGTIKIAYAAASAIPEGDILAALTFTCRGSGVTTLLTVDTQERGDELKLKGETRTFLVVAVPQSSGGSSGGGTSGGSEADNNVIPDDGGLRILPCAGGHSGMVAVQVTDGGRKLIRKSVYDSGTRTVRFAWDGSGEVVIEDNSKSFRDTANHWAKDAINFAASHELFNGVGDGAFAPDSGMTRAMLVTVLHRLEDEPASGRGGSFRDVVSGAWYADAVYWAKNSGIVDGYGNDRFGTEDNITREQMVVILYRYAQYLGLDISAAVTLDQFSDSGDVSSWARTALEWAVANGVITGKPGSLLDPVGEVKRAEVAVVLQRMVSLMLR